MLRIYAAESSQLASRLESYWQPAAQLRERVSDILENVQREGDAALVRFSREYDQHPAQGIDELILKGEALEDALHSLDDRKVALLRETIERITDFHARQTEQGFLFTDAYGNRMGQRVAPLARVGLYTPGGRAAYPSSLIMNAVPARVAGVPSLTVCCPAPQGRINPLVLGVAGLLEVERVIMVGGAQAVAALAFGTESVPKVDKITGPGNAWVAEAKRQVYGRVGLDMLAGPSEILIISDGGVDPQLVLADLCAQAEHDPEARALLLTTSEDEAHAVQQLAEAQQVDWPRAEVIKQAFARHGGIVLCRSQEQAVELANRIAPEHLEVLTSNAGELVEQLHNAGAIFIGGYTCESFGDYCAGPNHVLPTAGSARFSSPLGVYDFIKRTTLLECSREGARELVRLAAPLAELEGLPAHRRAAELRSTL